MLGSGFPAHKPHALISFPWDSGDSGATYCRCHLGTQILAQGHQISAERALSFTLPLRLQQSSNDVEIWQSRCGASKDWTDADLTHQCPREKGESRAQSGEPRSWSKRVIETLWSASRCGPNSPMIFLMVVDRYRGSSIHPKAAPCARFNSLSLLLDLHFAKAPLCLARTSCSQISSPLLFTCPNSFVQLSQHAKLPTQRTSDPYLRPPFTHFEVLLVSSSNTDSSRSPAQHIAPSRSALPPK